MTTIFTKQDREAGARAMKESLRVAFDGKPLLGDTKSDDWYADGGVIDLTELFQTGLTAAMASVQARGAIVGYRDMPDQTILMIRLDKEAP